MRKRLLLKLVIDMMEIGLDERIPTTEHISQALNKNGWNLGEVANVWSSSAKVADGQWNEAAIEALGGIGSVSRIWHELKSAHLCGFPKRSAEDPSSQHCRTKRQRLMGNRELSTSSNCSGTPSKATLESNHLH